MIKGQDQNPYESPRKSRIQISNAEYRPKGCPRRETLSQPEVHGTLKTIGRHLIAEFYCCDLELLDDVARIEQHMLQAARLIGATVMGSTFHRFDPQGVSGTVVISESHLSIHTWPENGYVAADIYTCGGLDPQAGFAYLAQSLESDSWRVQEILRGIPEDLEDHDLLLPDDVQVVTRWVEAKEMSPTVAVEPSQR